MARAHLPVSPFPPMNELSAAESNGTRIQFDAGIRRALPRRNGNRLKSSVDNRVITRCGIS